MPIVFPEILVYIMVMMLTSIDFWVVKNIVGRKLVKMRWWFIIDNEGNERWHYEFRGNFFLTLYFRCHYTNVRQTGLLGYSLWNSLGVGSVLCDERPYLCDFQDGHDLDLHDYRCDSVLGLQELQSGHGCPCQENKGQEGQEIVISCEKEEGCCQGRRR